MFNNFLQKIKYYSQEILKNYKLFLIPVIVYLIVGLLLSFSIKIQMLSLPMQFIIAIIFMLIIAVIFRTKHINLSLNTEKLIISTIFLFFLSPMFVGFISFLIISVKVIGLFSLASLIGWLIIGVFLLAYIFMVFIVLTFLLTDIEPNDLSSFVKFVIVKIFKNITPILATILAYIVLFLILGFLHFIFSKIYLGFIITIIYLLVYIKTLLLSLLVIYDTYNEYSLYKMSNDDNLDEEIKKEFNEKAENVKEFTNYVVNKTSETVNNIKEKINNNSEEENIEEAEIINEDKNEENISENVEENEVKKEENND